jgi:hypothetical protein
MKYIVACLGDWDTQFGLLVGFIKNLKVVTTRNYYTQLKSTNHTPNLHTANLLYSASLTSATSSTVYLFRASDICFETDNH